MHLWRRLGIARSNKFVGLCSRLAQTFNIKQRTCRNLARPLLLHRMPVVELTTLDGADRRIFTCKTQQQSAI